MTRYTRRPVGNAHVQTSTTLEDVETGEEVDVDLKGDVSAYVPARTNCSNDLAHDAEGGEVEDFEASIGGRVLSEAYLKVRFGKTDEDLMPLVAEAVDEDERDYSDEINDRDRDERRWGED